METEGTEGTEGTKTYQLFDIVKFMPVGRPSYYTIAYITELKGSDQAYFKSIFSKTRGAATLDENIPWIFDMNSENFTLEIIGNKETNPEYFL